MYAGLSYSQEKEKKGLKIEIGVIKTEIKLGLNCENFLAFDDEIVLFGLSNSSVNGRSFCPVNL